MMRQMDSAPAGRHVCRKQGHQELKSQRGDMCVAETFMDFLSRNDVWISGTFQVATWVPIAYIG